MASTNGEGKDVVEESNNSSTLQDMTEKLSCASFGDGGDNKMPNSGGGPEFEQAEQDKIEDSLMDMGFDDTQEWEEERLKAERAKWDVTEPSQDYLNKLDGWSPKLSTCSTVKRISDISLEALPISAIQTWLRENIRDDYTVYCGDSMSKKQKRGARVRWADIESRLQKMGMKLHAENDSSVSGSQA